MIFAARRVVVKTLTRIAMLVAVASFPTGCISLFPKMEPAQLYRFGTTTPRVQETATGQPGFGVMLTATGFDRAAASDRILTVTGMQAAYIKDARWVTAAVGLFDSALQRAFDADQGPARLVDRAEITHTDYLLKLDVRTFEVRYDDDQAATPTIVVEVHAAMDRTRDRIVVGDRSFKAVVAASENRVGAIAQAFDRAVNEVLGELVAWVNGRGEG
jgi:cholesterol transport system auxiliary component